MHTEKTLKVLSGCRALNIKKGEKYTVTTIESLGSEYSHGVRLVLVKTYLSLAGNTEYGKKTVLWARHMNRLNDAEFNLNNGDPFKKIRVKFV